MVVGNSGGGKLSPGRRHPSQRVNPLSGLGTRLARDAKEAMQPSTDLEAATSDRCNGLCKENTRSRSTQDLVHGQHLRTPPAPRPGPTTHRPRSAFPPEHLRLTSATSQRPRLQIPSAMQNRTPIGGRPASARHSTHIAKQTRAHRSGPTRSTHRPTAPD